MFRKLNSVLSSDFWIWKLYLEGWTRNLIQISVLKISAQECEPNFLIAHEVSQKCSDMLWKRFEVISSFVEVYFSPTTYSFQNFFLQITIKTQNPGFFRELENSIRR